jgi:hypothetical protein
MTEKSPIEILTEIRESYHKDGNRKQERVFDRAIAILEVAD